MAAVNSACFRIRDRAGSIGHLASPRRRPGQALSRSRPLRRRAASTARPARVRMRSRNPCVFARWRLLGWKVRLLTSCSRRGQSWWLRQLGSPARWPVDQPRCRHPGGQTSELVPGAVRRASVSRSGPRTSHGRHRDADRDSHRPPGERGGTLRLPEDCCLLNAPPTLRLGCGEPYPVSAHGLVNPD